MPLRKTPTLALDAKLREEIGPVVGHNLLAAVAPDLGKLVRLRRRG